MSRPLCLFALTAVLCLPAPVSAQWYAALDLLVPTRRDSSDTVFARSQFVQDVLDADGNPVLDDDGNPLTTSTVGEDILASAPNLELNYETGGRLTVGRRFGVWGLEGKFLRTDDFTKVFSLADSNGQLASPFTPVGAEVDPVFDNNTNIDLAFETEMQAAELNLFRLGMANCHGEGFFLAGVRYLAVDDILSYTSTNAEGSFSRVVNTDNVLVGPQFGIVSYSPLKCGLLRIALKWSAAYNKFDKFTTENGGLPVRALGDDDETCFIGEFGIAYEFRPIYHTSIRIGYDMFVASEVALAVDNFDTGQRIVTEDALYHIPYVGLVVKY